MFILQKNLRTIVEDKIRKNIFLKSSRVNS
jgi:hypothetical protein